MGRKKYIPSFVSGLIIGSLLGLSGSSIYFLSEATNEHNKVLNNEIEKDVNQLFSIILVLEALERNKVEVAEDYLMEKAFYIHEKLKKVAQNNNRFHIAKDRLDALRDR